MEDRTVHLSKHEVVIDRYAAEDIWEVAFGADAWEREFPDNEVIRVLQSYEKKAHKYDTLMEALGLEVEEDIQ